MSLFTDTVKQDTPRLVVMYSTNENGNDQYQWGVVGNPPLLSLLGHIGYMQSQLMSNVWLSECPQSALCLAWDADEREFNDFVHPSIPRDSLCGMLEVIKSLLTAGRIGQHMASQQVLLGPDGRPFNKGIAQ